MSAADGDLTREEFLNYVGSLDLAARYPGTTGVGFLVPADDAGLPTLRQRLDLGDPTVDAGGGVPGGGAHFIVTSSYRPDGQPSSLGIDLAEAQEAADAIRRARDEGTPTLSETYVHISDRRLPPDEQQLSFIVATPL